MNRFHPSDPTSSNSSSTDPHQPVRSTDLDALLSRSFAASLSYLSDPYSQLFLPPNLRRSLTSSANRRPPLISIGTHARTWAVDKLVRDFLLLHSTTTKGKGKGRAVGDEEEIVRGGCQILSLGAGTDARFFRFRREWEEQGLEWNCAMWTEVDLEETTSGKARVISTKEELKGKLGGEVKIGNGGTSLHSPLYSLIPSNLLTLFPPSPSTPSSPLPASLALSPSLPTLLLAECVLIYLPPENVDAILRWFTNTFSRSGGGFVGYDPFGLEDAFGQVMRRNLATRNLTLPSAASTPNLSSLEERLHKNGFPRTHSSVGALSVRQIRDEVMDKGERERVNAIERIDEVEELNLVLEHYAITWGNLGGVEEGEGIGLRKQSS